MKRKHTSIFLATLLGFAPLGFADNLGADDQADTVPAGQDAVPVGQNSVPAGQDAVPTNDENIVDPDEDEELPGAGGSPAPADNEELLDENAGQDPVQFQATLKKADGTEVDVTDQIQVRQTEAEAEPDEAADAAEASATLVATLMPTEGNDTKGTVTFSANSEKEGVDITIKATGLKPNSQHAIHIHEFGDVSAPDGTSAGGHFNPDGHDHGLPDQEMRHAGDLGNLEADADGMAMKTMTVTNFTLMGLPNSILGRSVVVHEGEDKGTQPTGDAGPRIAVGVIGIQALEMPGEKKSAAPNAAKPGHEGHDHSHEDMPKK